MTGRLPLLAAAALVLACGGSGGSPATDDAGGSGFEPPVLTNPEVPVRYPPDLYQNRTEGTVVLRLFVDADGTLIPDSTRVAEGSGTPALDSAALAAVALMRFAPARQEGVPVGTAFLQPVHFRHPDASGTGEGT
jgi:periplasmic protein TonB